jgi:rhodanese-related sulfurtransferase
MEAAMTPEPVSAAEAKQLLDSGESIVFVDARNPVAWGSSHQQLPGAVRIPVDEVTQHLGELTPGAIPITYCT